MSDDRADDWADDWIRDVLLLKRTPRSGWFRTGVSRPESVADHSWAAAMLAWRLARETPGVDVHRVVLMALLHDFAEARLTDLPTPAKQRLPEGAFDAAEAAVIEEQWPDDAEARAVLDDFRAGESPEARLAAAVDNLEFLFQAAGYRRAGRTLTGGMLARARKGAAWNHPATRPHVERILAELED